MSAENNFDIFVGGNSGVFKGVRVGTKDCVIKNIQSLVSITDDDQVTTVSWGDEEEKEVLIACGVKGVRSVKVYDTESSTFTCSFFCNIGKGSINGISRYDEAILTAVHSGEIKLWRFDKEDEILIRAGENLNRMRHSRLHRNIIATGGQEHRLQLFDLETQRQTFSEKNLPHDSLQLRVPIWISDIDFLPGTEHIATAGRYGHVRLYDPKSQRRPVINLQLPDQALTTLCVTPKEKQIIVGSGTGRMNLIDLRKPGRILNTYKGFTGSITSIACSSTEPYVVSVGLDRYLRVHHIDTKRLLKKIYLTSKITCMVVHSGFSLRMDDENNENVQNITNGITESNSVTNKSKLRDSAESDEEYDMLFDKMQTVSNKDDQKLTKKNKEEVIEDSSTDNEEAPSDAVRRRKKELGKAQKKLKLDA